MQLVTSRRIDRQASLGRCSLQLTFALLTAQTAPTAGAITGEGVVCSRVDRYRPRVYCTQMRGVR